MHRHVLNRLDTKRLHICLILCLYKQHTGIEACACAVYGRENRLKVKRDEEQAAKEEAEKAAIHQKAESEYRHALLLKRAQQKSGTDESSRKGIAAVDNVAIEAAHELVKDRDDSSAALVPAATNSLSEGRQAFDLLGFLQTKDPKAEHPEVATERKLAAAKRGQEITQTSDAKFDAQFAFAHGLAGEANEPWYAKKSQAPGLEPTGSAESEPIQELLAMEGGSSAQAEVKEKKRKLKSKEKDKKKDKHKRRHADEAKKHCKEINSKQKSADVFAVLRAEREAREASERLRANQAVLNATFNADGAPDGKRYHGSYGSRRHRR